MRFRNFVGSMAIGLMSLAAPGPIAIAQSGPMTYIYNLDDSEFAARDQYLAEVIRTALERSRAAYGDYVLKLGPGSRQQRRVHNLENATGEINFSLLPARSDFYQTLIPVRISIDRGILGYRIMLIRAADQPQFDRIDSRTDLKPIRFGMLDSWAATQVMRAAGLTVVAGSSYDGLFKMLQANRFDALDRSAYEILPEFHRRQTEIPDLAIERHLVLHYPLPDYFWFANTAEGRRLAERMQLGLAAMEADGSLDALFEKTFAPAIKQLDLAHRRIIELPNAMMRAEDRQADKAPWHRSAGPSQP